MGPNFWRHPANGLKKCSEKTRTSCTDHDDCCAVTACTYCLELEVYGDPVQHGVADQAANHWTGTVGGYPFDMYWERNYETGVCELIVIFDGEEVYRKSCEDGQSCRDSSDEVEVIVGYPPESATLRWIKHEPLALPHVNDPDTGCKTWFCGECECSCDCLCVTVLDSNEVELGFGEICTINYECEAPVWQGTVAGYDLSIALVRGEYGECLLIATVDGYEQPPVEVAGCKDMSARIVLEDGTIFDVACKICSCRECPCICCPDCWALVIGSTFITIYAEDLPPGGVECSGVGTGGFTPAFAFTCGGSGDIEIGYVVVPDTFAIRIFCDDDGQWKVQYKSPATGVWGSPYSSWEWVDTGASVPCPDCTEAVDGVYTVSFDFLADFVCENSGGFLVSFQVAVECVIDFPCAE